MCSHNTPFCIVENSCRLLEDREVDLKHNQATASPIDEVEYEDEKRTSRSERNIRPRKQSCPRANGQGAARGPFKDAIPEYASHH